MKNRGPRSRFPVFTQYPGTRSGFTPLEKIRENCTIGPYGWPKLQITSSGININSEIPLVSLINLQIAPYYQISLKFLTDSVRRHVSANKMTTRVDHNKNIK
jgi:hypothetical protein